MQSRSPSFCSAFDWLVDGAPGATCTASMLGRLAPRLVDAGLPLRRVSLCVSSLHPYLLGQVFAWRAERPEVQRFDISWSVQRELHHNPTPFGRVLATGAEVRVRFGDAPLAGYGPDLAALQAQGATDYVALPISSTDEPVHVASFATVAPGGFREEHLEQLREIVRPLGRMIEILALRKTAENLLDAYVGHQAGARILAGRMQRGSVEHIRCVIWFSDLRGFTALSNERPSHEVIRLLNDVFDCQVPAIEAHGGEVLKFMGDGLLAIFPLDERGAGSACQLALNAARAVQQALAALNDVQRARGKPTLELGTGLHLGEVAYGNIGGAARLDFTCIGSAVNLTARLEGLAGRLNRPVLLSEDFVSASEVPAHCLGSFELKGFDAPARVFVPAA